MTFEPPTPTRSPCRSDRADGSVRIPLATKPGEVTGWAAYVAGVVWALRMAGHPVPGGTMSVTSDVADGLGAVVVGGAGVRGAGRACVRPPVCISTGWSRRGIAQRAENEYVGAPTGLLDQLSSLFGEASTALLIDFRELTVDAGAVRPGRLRCGAAADRLPRAARSCRRRIRRASAVV